MRARFLAACAAPAVFFATLIWGVVALDVVTKNFDGYCEDFSSCIDGEPVLTAIQAVMALVGIFAAIWLGVTLVRYARNRVSPGRLARPALVVLVSFVVWLLAVWPLG